MDGGRDEHETREANSARATVARPCPTRPEAQDTVDAILPGEWFECAEFVQPAQPIGEGEEWAAANDSQEAQAGSAVRRRADGQCAAVVSGLSVAGQGVGNRLREPAVA